MLWQRASQCSDVTLIAPAQLQQVAFGDNEAFITLQDGSMMSARLLIAADGANSWLRDKADIPITFWDYEHHALVANVRTDMPHDAIARRVPRRRHSGLPADAGSAPVLHRLVTVTAGSGATAIHAGSAV